RQYCELTEKNMSTVAGSIWRDISGLMDWNINFKSSKPAQRQASLSIFVSQLEKNEEIKRLVHDGAEEFIYSIDIAKTALKVDDARKERLQIRLRLNKELKRLHPEPTRVW